MAIVSNLLGRSNKSFLVVVIKLFSALITFYATVEIANSLKFNDANEYFYTLNVALMFGLLSTLGIKNYIIEVNGVDNNHEQKVAKMLSSAILLTVLSLIFLTPIIYLYSDEKFLLTFLLSFSCLMNSLSTSYLYSLQKQILGVFVETILPYGLLVILLFSGVIQSYDEAIIFLILAMLSLSLYSFFKGQRKWGLFTGCSHKDITNFAMSKKLRLYATTMLLSSLVSYYPVQIGAFFLEDDQITFVLIAIKISSTLRVFYSALVSIYTPKISYAYRNYGPKELSKLVKSSTLVLTFCGISGTLVIFLFSDFIVSLYGPDYELVNELLPYVLLFQCMFISTGVVGHALMMTDNTNVLKKALINNLIFCFPISILCCYFFGIIGFIVGYGILLSGQHVFSSYYLYKKLGINVLIFYK